MAKRPRLYIPLWSEEILNEVREVQSRKLNPPWPRGLVDLWQEEVRRSFPEALVTGHECLHPAMTNDEDDRHVVAAAILGQAQLIATFNLRHFAPEHLAPWQLEAVHPQDYLITLLQMRPELVISRLFETAGHHGQKPLERLNLLAKSVPKFAEMVAGNQEWELETSA